MVNNQIMMIFNRFLLMMLNLRKKKKVKLKAQHLLEEESLDKFLENLIKNKVFKLNVFLNQNKQSFLSLV